MSPDQFRASLRAVPLVPFRIHLVDQRSFDVPHPEFVMLVPSGRTACVVPPGLDAAEVVDVSLIVSLQPITPPGGGDAGGVGGREDSGIRTRSDIITCMDEALARRQGWPIEVHPLHDRDAARREREYWMCRTPAERMEALDRLREERDGPQPRLARVARVIERKRG